MKGKIKTIKSDWECLLGRKSHLNLFGKVVFFPLLILMVGIFALMTIVFEKPC